MRIKEKYTFLKDTHKYVEWRQKILFTENEKSNNEIRRIISVITEGPVIKIDVGKEERQPKKKNQQI